MGYVRMATRFPIILALALAVCLRVPAAADSDVANKSETALSEDIWKRDTFTADWGGARKSLEDARMTFTVTEESELWANLTGGLRSGGAYAGLTTASVKLDLAKLVSWQGATFFVNSFQIHGFGPSANFVGNQQFVSNIEATPSTKLYDLWLDQALFNDRVSIRIGQEGMNDEFMTSQASEIFLNGSFGYPDLNERNLPSSGPNYPLATPMVRAKVKITDQFSYIGAIFNGDPAGPGRGTGPEEEDPQIRDASGTAFRLQDPPLIVNELWYSVGEDKPSAPLPGIYKIGAWVHTGSFGLSKNNYTGLPLPFTIPAPLYRGDFSVYALADQMVWRKPGTKDEGVTLFGLVMGAPEERNAEDLYAEGGIQLEGYRRKPPAGRVRCRLRLCAHKQCVSALGRGKHCLDRKRSVIREQRDNHRGYIPLPSRTLVDVPAGYPVCVQSWRISSAAGCRHHDDLEERSCDRRSHQDRFLGFLWPR